MMSQPLDAIPLGWLFVLVSVLAGLALEGGYRLGQRRRMSSSEKEVPINTMVGSMLGLLAFLLAFTFSLAESRHDEHRQAILDEANAIGTTYLRTRLLPEPEATQIAVLLREYVDVRVHGATATTVEDAIRRSESLHEQIWSKAIAAAKRPESIPPLTALFFSSLNETIDDHAIRIQAGGRSRIPFALWVGLYSLALLAMASVGYQSGLSGTRRSPAMLTLVIAFAGVLMMIADLDRAREGFIRVSFQPLVDVQNSMQTEKSR